MIAEVAGLRNELALVDKYIEEFLHSDSGSQLDGLLDVVRGSRGKMLRPSLLLLAARFGSRQVKRQRLCQLAALVEMVHMASLIHDDIIDDSPLRRGRPTVQARFGKDMAVYAGDFVLSRVMRQLFLMDMPSGGIIIGRVIEEMCYGELGQAACRWDTETDVSSYLTNIQRKSAALFAASMRLGALESGCSQRRALQLDELGGLLGCMFQLRDDLRDCLPQEQRRKQSKPINQDFAAGVYTLPALYAFRHSPQAKRLRQLAAMPAQTLPTDEALALIETSGGLAYTRGHIAGQAEAARRLLAELPSGEATSGLESLLFWLEGGKSALKQTPLEQTPLEQTPLEQTPLEQTPLEQTSLEQTSPKQTSLLTEGPQKNKITLLQF